MSLWGKKDDNTVSGTVVLTTGSATVTANSATSFATELQVGDAVYLSGANTAPGTTTRYKVVGIANNTSMTIDPAYAAANNAAATLRSQQSPKDLPATDVGVANKRSIVGLDLTEAGITANKARGLTTPGWNSVKVGTGGRAGRYSVETLVAMRSMTAAAAADANDDSVAADS